MRPLTDHTPKPMLPVADRPLVAHTADTAIQAGADELIFVVGYEAEAVRSYFGDEYGGVPVSFAVQEEQLGTADAVAAAKEHLEGPFAVLNGDNLYDAESLSGLFDAAPSVAAYRVDDPTSYGVLSTEGDTITGIVEKPDDPPTDLANAGAYVFPAEARDWLDVPLSDRGEREITDVLAKVIEESTVTAVAVDRWLDVGRPWELLEANEWKLGQLDRRLDGEVRAMRTCAAKSSSRRVQSSNPASSSRGQRWSALALISGRTPTFVGRPFWVKIPTSATGSNSRTRF